MRIRYVIDMVYEIRDVIWYDIWDMGHEISEMGYEIFNTRFEMWYMRWDIILVIR